MREPRIPIAAYTFKLSGDTLESDGSKSLDDQ